MNRVCWWIVDVAARMLETQEREVVCGDLAESGESGVGALSDVFGLVVRRQVALWSDWRPWVTLVCLIVPLGMVLSLLARPSSSQSAVYLWLYANNWDWALLRHRGFWYVLAESAGDLSMLYVTLACSSWTIGFVLGRFSSRTIWTNGVLFCLMLLFGEVVGAPRYFAYYTQYMHRVLLWPKVPDAHPSVPPFYNLMFPLIVQAFLVAIPALRGMGQGVRVRTSRTPARTIVWIAALASLAAMLIHVPGSLMFLGIDPWTWQQIRLVRVLSQCLSVAVYWPVAYLVARAIGERWHRGRIVWA